MCLSRRGKVLFDAAVIAEMMMARRRIGQERLGMAMRTGTLVDATLIALASIGHDREARWAGHRRRKPVHGHKAHVATDQDAGLIHGVEITTANVHDAAELEAVLASEPGDVFGD